MFEKYGDVVTVTQLAEMLCISKKIAYSMLKAEQIPYQKIGRIYRIPKSAVEDFMHNKSTNNKNAVDISSEDIV